MADPSNSAGSLDPQKLNDLRASLSQATSSSVHRSQTVPNQVGRTKVDAEQPFSKLASRSYTMPTSKEGALMELTPLVLDMASHSGTATPIYKVDLQVDKALPGMPLNPVRRSPTTRADVLNNKHNFHNNGHRRLITWIVCCLSVLIIAPVLSIVLGVTLHAPNFEFASKATGLPGRNLTLLMNLVSADPVNSVATFDWIITADNNSPCDDADAECTDVNIFFDSNLLIGNGNTMSQHSSDIPSVPVFRLNATTYSTGDFRAASPIFRTDILVISHGLLAESSLVHYPFDIYESIIYMFAQDSNNQSVNLGISGSSGNAVGFSTLAYDDSTGVLPGAISITLFIKRGALVRAFCIIIIIAIWLITMILLLLTLTSIIFGFRQRAEVLIVPVATIFAFTQLRSSMPGAPEGFGDILDFVGLLPCLAILAFSAALSLGAFILTDPTQKTQVLTWARLRRELRHAREGPSIGNAKHVDDRESEYSIDPQ